MASKVMRPCGHCGAEDSVPFNEIDFENEPATITIEKDLGDGKVIQDQGHNPLHYATPQEYRAGLRYGRPAACDKCGHVSMPVVEDDSVTESPAIARPYAPAQGVIQTAPD